MNETLYIFEEAIANNLFKSPIITVVRKNGKIFDFVLEGEPIKESEQISKENLTAVLSELRTYK
ncbi:competence regulator inhibitor paratox [Streptococcus suis]|uniref:competence regulator inhibitor paratox n=1 Tax=Streptococcus suis TaxID=1307 RepID=UPI003F8B68A3